MSGSGAVMFSVDDTDRHRWVSALAMLGLAAAVTMAVVGLPPVDLHGPLHKFGIMDPLCGGTRAARFTAQGNLAEAWRCNPLSIVIVGGGAVALARTLIGVASRRWFNLRLALTPRQLRVVAVVAVVLVVLLEIRQQLRADLLMQGTQVWR